jgi:hypothetical protein
MKLSSVILLFFVCTAYAQDPVILNGLLSGAISAQKASAASGAAADVTVGVTANAMPGFPVADPGVRMLLAHQFTNDKIDKTEKSIIDNIKAKLEINKWIKNYQVAREGVNFAKESVNLTRNVIQSVKNSEETAKRLWGDLKNLSDIEAYVAMYNVQMQNLYTQHRVNHDMMNGNANAYEAIVGKYRTNGLIDPLKVAKGYVDSKVTGQAWIEVTKANRLYDQQRVEAWMIAADNMDMQAFQKENLAHRIIQLLNFRAMGAGGNAWSSFQSWSTALGRAETSIGFKTGINDNYKLDGTRTSRGVLFESKDKFDKALGDQMEKNLLKALPEDKRTSVMTELEYRNYAESLLATARELRSTAAATRALAYQTPLMIDRASRAQAEGMNTILNESTPVNNLFIKY